MKQSKNKTQKPTIPGMPEYPTEKATSAARWKILAEPIKRWNKVHPNDEQQDLPSIKQVKARAWMLTIPADGEKMVPQEVVDEVLGSEAKAAVYSEEKGKTTGYLHYQAFVIFPNPRHGSALIEDLFPGYTGVHYEPATESTEQCVIYCTKKESHIKGPFWLGHPEKIKGMAPTGKQTELRDRFDEAEEKLRSGWHYKDFILDREWRSWAIRNKGGIMDLDDALATEIYGEHDRDISVDYLWGAPGSGKTQSVMKLYGYENVFSADFSSSFPFDGYRGESVLLLDDFRGNIIFNYLLRVLDRYPLRVNVKGSHVWARWTKVVISANIPLGEQYPNLHERKDPLLRRFERGIVFEKPDPSTKLPYDSREDAMIGKRNDGGANGVPGYKPAWERTPEETADAAIDDVFSAFAA